MKIVGLITEYNPLHNGHIHHINEVKKLSNADVLITVMSSSFTMRGDLSLFDKFTKTKQALKAGCDIVIELPLIYAIERADIFAKNAVLLLNLAKVSEIWIGSEENDISLYEKYYDEQKNIDNKEDYKTSFKNKSNIELKSNDILGYSYYKAIKDNNLNIELHTIKRIKSDYLDDKPNHESITSALSIRNDLSLLDKYTPSFVANDKNKILDENKLFSFLKYKILSSDTKYLKEIFFVDEGLENRLHDIINYNSYDDFINSLVTKRYTKTRIKRMLVYILLDIKKDTVNNIYEANPNSIRVLGYSDSGQLYIKSIKKETKIYTNIKNNINDIFDIELKASSILDSVYNTELLKQEMKSPQKI